MCSLATARIAQAASSTPSPSGSATTSLGSPRVRRRRVERDPAAEEVVRVDVAEHDRGVRDRRLGAAAAVAGRARAPRPRSAGRRAAGRRESIQAMLPPPAPMLFTSTDERPVMCPVNIAAEPGLARELDVAVADDADVEARAARVADDDVVDRRRVDLAGDRRHRRARVDRVDRAARDVVEVQHSAERRHDEQLAREARRAQIALHLAQVRLHQRLERRVDRRRRGAPVLADDRVQPVRERVRDARELLARSARRSASSCAGLAIDHSSETATASTSASLELRAGSPSTSASRRAGTSDVALGRHPLGDLERQAAGDVGLRVRRAEVERVQLAALAQDQRVGEALGGQERRARRRCR